MGTTETSSVIYPICHHDRADAAPSMGWIFCCRPDYENAIRRNLLKYSDQTLPLRLEDDLKVARERVQTLESDIQDMRMLCKQAFVRCAGCHRLKEVSKSCRWCHP